MSSERLHHLDALRALTMVLILPAHALALIGLRGGWNDVEATDLLADPRLPPAALLPRRRLLRAPCWSRPAGQARSLRNRARPHRRPARRRRRSSWCRVLAPAASGAWRPIADRAGSTASAPSPTSHPSFLWFLWYLAMIYAAALAIALAPRQARRALSGACCAEPARACVPHWVAPLAARHPVRPAPLPAADLDRRCARRKASCPQLDLLGLLRPLLRRRLGALRRPRPARARSSCAAALRGSSPPVRCRRPWRCSCCRTSRRSARSRCVPPARAAAALDRHLVARLRPARPRAAASCREPVPRCATGPTPPTGSTSATSR